MCAAAAQGAGTSRSVPVNAPQGLGKVLGEKEKLPGDCFSGKPPLPSGEEAK